MATGASLRLVWPARRRCLGCRRYFGFQVVQGLFCSHACAQADTSPDLIAAAPRSCVVVPTPNEQALGKKPRWKRRYASLSQVSERQLSPAGSSLYRCPHCGTLHVGRVPASISDDPSWEDA